MRYPDYVPGRPVEVGDEIRTAGYVTHLMNVLGAAPAELERRIGYSAGSLADGYDLALLTETVLPGEFEFRGMTHFPDGVPRGEARNVHEALQARYGGHGVDRASWTKLCNEGAARLNAPGARRTCKVLPRRIPNYPPGSGVPQYRLRLPKWFIIGAAAGPGQHLRRTQDGDIHAHD